MGENEKKILDGSKRFEFMSIYRAECKRASDIFMDVLVKSDVIIFRY